MLVKVLLVAYLVLAILTFILSAFVLWDKQGDSKAIFYSFLAAFAVTLFCPIFWVSVICTEIAKLIRLKGGTR